MVGVLAAMALLLAAAGAGKVVRPTAAAHAWAAARVPGAAVLAAPAMVRILGLVEVLIAGAVLGRGGQLPAAMLGAAYLVLTAVAWRMIKVAPTQDCGCFGSGAEPISRWHLVIDSGGVLIGVLAVRWPHPSFVSEVVSFGGAESVLLVLLTVLLTWLCYLAMTALPDLLTLRAKVATPR